MTNVCIVLNKIDRFPGLSLWLTSCPPFASSRGGLTKRSLILRELHEDWIDSPASGIHVGFENGRIKPP